MRPQGDPISARKTVSQEQLIWKSIQGRDLIELHQEGKQLTDLVPPNPGIYMWKLNLDCPGFVRGSPELFAAWLDKMAQVTSGTVGTLRLSHAMWLTGIELRGSPLPANKSEILKVFLLSSQNRSWLGKFVKGFAPSLPALYVGESGNIAKRAAQHLSGESDFGRTVLDSTDLVWEDLDFLYCEVGSQESELSTAEVRRTLEYWCASMTIAGLTRRPG